MHASRPPRHARTGPSRGHLVALYVVIAIETVALIVVLALLVQLGARGAAASADAGVAQNPPQLSDAQQLILAQGGDANSCAVSFRGDGITDTPVLEQQGTLYQHLPIPRRDGQVFGGWYRSAADAAAFTQTARVNGSEAVACADQQETLYGAWKKPADVAAENTGVPILMYHQFTTNANGESNSLRGNYIYIGDFEKQIAYLADQHFYLPTWPELSAFIDGALYLPKKSVIVTDDDADKTWLELAVPIVDKFKVLTTSFVITKWRHEGTPSLYVLQRSHTDDMHEAGANGKGRMVNYTKDQIVADMLRSAQILGVREVMAYPFGHYNDTAKAALREAGFEMARTIEQGYVRPGADKLALPCIRVDYGETMAAFTKAVG
ncbi:polysaccharide deacetylase family protein [Microbacterium sp. X-17]|uniref:polysaccharide deacetylase family protein n=1 Tax=Microbacterium sp. X-17 TaxID=3144404 RepID=UPI0031F529C6